MGSDLFHRATGILNTLNLSIPHLAPISLEMLPQPHTKTRTDSKFAVGEY